MYWYLIAVFEIPATTLIKLSFGGTFTPCYRIGHSYSSSNTYVLLKTIYHVSDPPKQLLVFFYRISTERWQRTTIMVIMVITLLYGIIFEFIVIFQCRPIVYFWKRFIGKDGQCLSTNAIIAVSYAHAVLCGVVDWILALLPVPMLWDMPMHWRLKMSIVAVLSLGAL